MLHPHGLRAATFAVALTLLAGCKRSYAVGDHVLVDWEKRDYPAMILEQPSPTKFRVHYDGYDSVWDEIVPKDRIKGHVEGTVVPPEPPDKVRAKAMLAAQSNVYKIGDVVRVEFHGIIYSARVTGIVGPEKYRIHYEGYGNEWDETVGLSRIQQK